MLADSFGSGVSLDSRQKTWNKKQGSHLRRVENGRLARMGPRQRGSHPAQELDRRVNSV